MKSLKTLASVTVLAATTGHASAAYWPVTGEFVIVSSVLGTGVGLPLSLNGHWDEVSGEGSWNVTADLSSLGQSVIVFDQDFYINAATGLGTLYTAYNCIGSTLACSGLSPEFQGPIDAQHAVQVGPLITQRWLISTPNLGIFEFNPVILPIPAAAWLFGSALLGLISFRTCRR